MVYRLSHIEKAPRPHANLVWNLRSVFCLPLQTLYTRRDLSTNQRLFSQNEPNFRSDENNATPFAAKCYQSKPPIATQRKRTQSKPNKANLKRGAYTAGRSSNATWHEIFLLASGNIRYIT